MWFLRAMLRNAPDDGGTGGSSLLDGAALSASGADGGEGAGASADSGDSTGADGAGGGDAEALKKADPFGDLAEYKDKENGLWLGKYKGLKDVFDGYKNQSGKLREKFPEAPAKVEDYRFTFDEKSGLPVRELTTEDPVLGAMAPVFKDANVSLEQAQKIAEGFMKYQYAKLPDIEAEKAKLGDELPSILDNVRTYAQKRKSPAFNKLAEAAGQSAELLQEFNLLLKSAGERPTPTRPGEGGASVKTAGELDAEARAYKEQHKATIDSNEHQQKTYYALLSQAQAAKKAQRT